MLDGSCTIQWLQYLCQITHISIWDRSKTWGCYNIALKVWWWQLGTHRSYMAHIVFHESRLIIGHGLTNAIDLGETLQTYITPLSWKVNSLIIHTTNIITSTSHPYLILKKVVNSLIRTWALRGLGSLSQNLIKRLISGHAMAWQSLHDTWLIIILDIT